MITTIGYIIANKVIVNNKIPVGFMYRENPSNENDSGWRFLVGNETDDVLDNDDNFAIYDVNTVLRYDKSIFSYLESPIGTALERNDDDTFSKIKY